MESKRKVKGSVTYIIHGKDGASNRTVTAYKPTMAYWLVIELIKFMRLPAEFPDVGITVLSENENDVAEVNNARRSEN